MALEWHYISISLCNTKLWHTSVYNRLRTLSHDTEIKFLSYPTRLNHFCQVAHTLPVGHAALWHNTGNVRTKTVKAAIFLCLLLVSVRRGGVITPLVGNAVLRRKPQYRILCECEALVSLIHTYLSSFSLDPENIRKLSIGAIWNFAKGIGLF